MSNAQTINYTVYVQSNGNYQFSLDDANRDILNSLTDAQYDAWLDRLDAYNAAGRLVDGCKISTNVASL